MYKKDSKEAIDHEENRGKICLLCLIVDTRYNRCKFTNILPEGAIEKKIKKLFEYNVSTDEHLPKALCNGCLK